MAMAAYARWLLLINYENRQCGLAATFTTPVFGEHHCSTRDRYGWASSRPTGPCASRHGPPLRAG
jgi:hypothetical protein